MDLEALKSLRSAGVKAARIGPAGEVVEVEFFPMAPEAEPDDGLPITPKSLGLDGDKCRCGHEGFEHAGNGLCLRGCIPDRCTVPDESK